MKQEEMQAEIERLRAENERLKGGDKGALRLKVSEKGALGLWNGTLSGHALSGTMAAPAGQGGRHQTVHPRQRKSSEDQRVVALPEHPHCKMRMRILACPSCGTNTPNWCPAYAIASGSDPAATRLPARISTPSEVVSMSGSRPKFRARAVFSLIRRGAATGVGFSRT